MKLPCSVVRDLLPLFAEKMTEPETRSLIEEHLRQCPECQRKYSETETEASPAVDTSAPLRSLKKEIRRRRLYAALIAGLFVLLCAVLWIYHTESLKPLSWQNGLVEVSGVRTVTEDEYRRAIHIRAEGGGLPGPDREALVLKADSRIANTETEIVTDEEGAVTAILQGFGRNLLLGGDTPLRETEILICPVPDRLIYGYENPQKILFGEPLNGGIEVLPRLTLSYYALIAAVTAAVTGLLWLIFRCGPRGRIIRQAFFAPVSYLIAHLLLMGLHPASFSILRDFAFILLTACVLYALLTLLWQTLLQRKKAA